MSTKSTGPDRSDKAHASKARPRSPDARERGEREGAAADSVLRDASGEPAVSGHNSSGASAETRRGLV